jgi:hypothetical protein
MAKASGSTTTAWISLSDARQLVVNAYESKELAERLLVGWLGEGKARWSCKLFEGPRAADLAARQREATGGAVWWVAPDTAFSEGDPAFWRASLKINWEDNSAHEQHVVGGARAYGIKIVREDVLAQLPGQLGEPEETTATSKGWIVEKARRMKRAGEIPDGIRKTDFAKLLEEQMKKAVSTGKVKKSVSWRYIKNRLEDWDLWPISSIK